MTEVVGNMVGGFLGEVQRLFFIMCFSFAALEGCFYIFPRMPRLKWDYYFDTQGITIYVPLVSTLALSIFLSFFLRLKILPF